MDEYEYKDIVEKTFIYVPTSQYQKKQEGAAINTFSYQYLADKLNLHSFYIFVLCVMIGKYVVDPNDVPTELPKDKETYTRLSYYDKKGTGIEILKAISIEEAKGDINILSDVNKMVQIWQLYAIAGFDKLCKWYYDSSEDFDSKLDDVLLDFFDKNKEFFKKSGGTDKISNTLDEDDE